MVTKNKIVEAILKKASTYDYTIKELANYFKISSDMAAKIMNENGHTTKKNQYLLKMKRSGRDIGEIINSAIHYRDNDVIITDTLKIFPNVNKGNILAYLSCIDQLPSVKDRKKRQKAWNKGLTKETNERVLNSARAASIRKSHSDSSIFEWYEKRKGSVKKYYKVWHENTGYMPDGKKGDQIHHIDGEHKNNEFDNLFLTDASSHTKIHKNYEKVAKELLKRGLIYFNKEKGEIEWKSVEKIIKKLSE